MKVRFFLAALLAVTGLFVWGCTEDPPNPVAVDLGSELEMSAEAPPIAWEVLAPVPTVGIGVEGMSVAVLGNTIVAALGHEFGDKPTTRLYDIDTDTWSFGANAPGASSEGAGVANGGLFYNVGGRGAGATALWTYDPSTDSWNNSLSQMPTPRQGLAACVVGDAIYAIGGRTSNGPNGGGKVDIVECYDILTDEWTTVAPLPERRSDMAAEVVGGKIYIFGGFDQDRNVLNDVCMYDPTTDEWTTGLSPMPTARGAMYAVATHGGTVYVIGGWDGRSSGLSTNEAYKVAQDEWTGGQPPMPTARAETGAVNHGGRIYIVGGGRPGFGLSVAANEVFFPPALVAPPVVPILALSPDTLCFDESLLVQTFDITNIGAGTLNWMVSDNRSWISASPLIGSDDATITVIVNPAGLPPGLHTGSVVVLSDGGNGTVAVKLTVPESPPVLVLSPTSLGFGSVAINSIFQISNSGGGTLIWSITDDRPWITVTPNAGSGDAIVTVAINRAGLSPGSYSGTVSVTSNGGNGTVSVVMGVAGTSPGAIGVFADQAGADCNLTDTTPGLLTYWVVHVNSPGAMAAGFSAPMPSCMVGATFLADDPQFVVTIGSSQTGVGVGYGVCLTSPITVLGIQYFAAGGTTPCCPYTVIEDPRAASGQVEAVDCATNLIFIAGLTTFVNDDGSCPCTVSSSSNTWVKMKGMPGRSR